MTWQPSFFNATCVGSSPIRRPQIEHYIVWDAGSSAMPETRLMASVGERPYLRAADIGIFVHS